MKSILMKVFSLIMVFSVLLGSTSMALADTISPDADIVSAGDQSSVNLGNVASGATIIKNVSFKLICNGSSHVDYGQIVKIAYASSKSTIPGGNLQATDSTIGSIPLTWPDDTNGSGNCGDTPPTLEDNVDSNVTITAPSASGTYIYTVKYDISMTPTGNKDSASITGNTSVTFILTVPPQPSDTTPPSLSLPLDMTVEATGPSGAAVSFTATATDANPTNPVVNCSPASGSTFLLGLTTVSCSAIDAANNTANGSFNITVQDTKGPVISAPSDITVEATSSSGATVIYDLPTATDVVDGSRPVSCNPHSGSTFILGETIVTCSSSDSRGNPGSSSFKIVVQDTSAPVLSLPTDMTIEATGPSGATASFSATANDVVDGNVPVNCTPISGNTFPLGSTTVSCSATDKAGNEATGSFKVTVQDTTPPTIATHPDIIEEATSAAGALVTYTAPATSDLVDGAGTATCVPASGSTFALGDTTVTCNATDAHKNAATAVTFKVTVQDTTPPTIDQPADQTVEGNTTGGANVSYTSPATHDAVDGDGFATCAPVSGSKFALGDTTVTCTATDAHGNVAFPVTFKVTVVDTTPPVLNNMPADQTVEGSTINGANVTFTPPTATDIVDASPSVSCVPDTGSFFALGGPHSVSCTATDSSGNQSSATFKVTVVDTTAPAITCPADITGTVGQAVALGDATVSDIVDASPAVANNAPSSYGPGLTTVTWTATDHSNNVSTCDQKVTLTYIFDGFYRPVDNLPIMNTVKSGSTVPVKWNLLTSSGSKITDVSAIAVGWPKMSQMFCNLSNPQEPVETLATGGTTLRYDLTGMQFVYNWQTPRNSSGTCWRLDVKFNDGTTKSANFMLK